MDSVIEDDAVRRFPVTRPLGNLIRVPHHPFRLAGYDGHRPDDDGDEQLD